MPRLFLKLGIACIQRPFLTVPFSPHSHLILVVFFFVCFLLEHSVNLTRRPLDWGGCNALAVYVSQLKPQPKMLQGSEIKIKDVSYAITYTWNLKYDTNEFINKTDRLNRQNRLVGASGEGMWEDGLESLGLAEANCYTYDGEKQGPTV